MAILERIARRFRLRGALAKPGDDGDEAKTVRLVRPQPTPTGRVPDRPAETPTARAHSIGGETAGTPSYGAPAGTPSTRRLHNPKQFR